MQDFYKASPCQIPRIFGMTASPVMGKGSFFVLTPVSAICMKYAINLQEERQVTENVERSNLFYIFIFIFF